MRIDVVKTKVGNRFAFLDDQAKEIVFLSKYLHPPGKCQGEKLEIMRGTVKIAEATIRYIDGHADGPIFGWNSADGLNTYNNRLNAEDFQSQDTILIHPKHNRKPQLYFGRTYWFLMLEADTYASMDLYKTG